VASWPGCSACHAPGSPDHQRHDRQPGGPVRRARAAPGPAASPTARRRTTPTAGCAACSASPGSAGGGRRRAGWTSARWTTCSRRPDRDGGRDGGDHRPGRDRSRARGARRRPQARGPGARRRGLRRASSPCWPACEGRAGAGPGAVAGHLRVRLGGGRPAQARAAAVRVRGGAVPRPGVGRFYLHDSPYTYFTSDELHLGEISLECSGPGAAAAALWLTFQLLPPTPAGWARSLPPAGGPRWTGPSSSRPPVAWCCSSPRNSTSSATSRSPARPACRRSMMPPADAGGRHGRPG
jgi:hypothetical protein